MNIDEEQILIVISAQVKCSSNIDEDLHRKSMRIFDKNIRRISLKIFDGYRRRTNLDRNSSRGRMLVSRDFCRKFCHSSLRSIERVFLSYFLSVRRRCNLQSGKFHQKTTGFSYLTTSRPTILTI